MRPLNKEMKYLCQMHTSFQMHMIIIYISIGIVDVPELVSKSLFRC